MLLVFDLHSLSAPTAWEHIINITAAIACTVAGVLVLRKEPNGNSAWQRCQRRFLVVFLFVMATAAAFGEARAILHSDQKNIARWIDEINYEVASGPIVRLDLKEKFLKSDPFPTFVVGTSSFEYGVYSKNHMLRNQIDGGPLLENREVLVWHHDGQILRLYVKVSESK